MWTEDNGTSLSSDDSSSPDPSPFAQTSYRSSPAPDANISTPTRPSGGNRGLPHCVEEQLLRDIEKLLAELHLSTSLTSATSNPRPTENRTLNREWRSRTKSTPGNSWIAEITEGCLVSTALLAERQQHVSPLHLRQKEIEKVLTHKTSHPKLFSTNRVHQLPPQNQFF